MQSRFDSRCQACGERIYEGDEIAKDDDLDAWVHEDCVDNVRPRKPSAPVSKLNRHSPSLAERLEADEGPTRGGIPVAGSSPAGSTTWALVLDEHEVRRVLDWLVHAESEGQAPAQGDEDLVKKFARCLPAGDVLREQCIGFLPERFR